MEENILVNCNFFVTTKAELYSPDFNAENFLEHLTQPNTQQSIVWIFYVFRKSTSVNVKLE